jgi:sortase (surface protein transpeptidase)
VHRSKQISRALLLFAAALCCLATWQLTNRYRATQGTATLPPDRIITDDSQPPSEKQPSKDQLKQYKVPANQPRLISIERIGVRAMVQRVSNTKANAIAAPSNIYYAGWYTQAAIPGQKGLSVIDGHVSGVYKPGVFKRLGELRRNDIIVIEYGNHRIKRFKVVELLRVPESQAGATVLSAEPSLGSQLNLITCAGSFNNRTGQYSDRLIVVSSLLDS